MNDELFGKHPKERTFKPGQSSAQTISAYLSFLNDTESPEQFHRWAFLSAVAARLGRRVFLRHGHNLIYPNMYVMLVGAPATRKSSSIKIPKELLADSGYSSFAFTKSSKQKFLIDWANGSIATGGKEFDMAAALDTPIPEAAVAKDPLHASSDCFIAIDEFIDFIGIGDFNFLSLLTTLWDNPARYDERLKNSESVSIPNPTLSILGGITPTSLALALPSDANGSGFLSRIILVYSEPTNRRIAFPRIPTEEERKVFVETLDGLQYFQGECTLSEAARKRLTDIYDSWENKLDIKLEFYAGRRFTHLLKLCLVLTSLEGNLEIQEATVIQANSILHFTEFSMAQALQEFGAARNLEATNKVLRALLQAGGSISPHELFQKTHTFFEKHHDFNLVVQNLINAKKIMIDMETNMLKAINLHAQDLANRHTDLAAYIPEHARAQKEPKRVHTSIELTE